MKSSLVPSGLCLVFALLVACQQPRTTTGEADVKRHIAELKANGEIVLPTYVVKKDGTADFVSTK